MYVELSMFSGRPNPRWRLDPKQADGLVERLKTRPLGGTAAERPVLGVRGFEIAPEPEEVYRYGLPPRFAIAASDGSAPRPRQASRSAPKAAAFGAPLRMEEEADAAEWLLENAEGVVDDEVIEAVRTGGMGAQEKSRSAAEDGADSDGEDEATARGEAAGALASAMDADACHPFLTPMRLWYWNQPHIRLSNNCYNYASNYASYTLAQPGRWAGRVYESFECDAVRDGAVADGCVPTCEGQLRVIALAVWPGFDFHWWRLHPGGFWAHKIGWTPATSRDNQGRIIGNGLSPETCDRGPYTTFCGYFFAPLGLRVQ